MEEIRECIEILVKNEIMKYESITIYGTGDGAHIAFQCLNRLRLLNKLKYVVDRDDSSIIGKKFESMEVHKIDDVIYDTDLIIIAAKIHRAVIKERLTSHLSNNGLHVTLLDMFSFASEKVRTNSTDECVQYVKYIEERHYKRKSEFVQITKSPYKYEKDDTKIIAWYLPQFYQMEVNNKYHGQGFTEWTNASQAIPLFVGHYQPHIPYDVGFYDLTNVDTLKRQVELAKMYGIYGFGFHYYWFSGIRTMEKPLDMLLHHKEIDLPFCLNWATENWTAKWDGGNYDIIYEQKLKDDDDVKFMEDIIPYMKDERYIKIEGRPVLSIFRCKLFEKERFTVLLDNFRKHAKRAGFPDLYILIGTYGFDEDVKEWGADALVEFPPSHIYKHLEPYKPNGYVNPYFEGSIFDYKKFVDEKKYLERYKSKDVFRAALVSFDNTARNSTWAGQVFMGANPETYKTWMKDILEENKTAHGIEDNLVFVSSWNEWAEGSHLEPDMKYGYGYLQATKEALIEVREPKEDVILNEFQRLKANGVSVIHFYVHCIESMGDIIACEPISRYLKQLDPKCKITWIIRDVYKEVVEYNPYVDEIMEVECLSQSIDLCDSYRKTCGNIIIDCHFDGRICSKTRRLHINLINPMINEKTYLNFGALLENFALSAGLPKLSDAPIFHQSPDVTVPRELPVRYVVLHCKSADQCKDWDADKWNRLAGLIMRYGYDIVEIGFEPVIRSTDHHYYDFTDIRSIQVISQIIRQAAVFVGIDSAFAHIANCYNKIGILIMGRYKSFEKPMPYTGNYALGKNVTILYAQNDVAGKVTVDEVYDVFTNTIE